MWQTLGSVPTWGQWFLLLPSTLHILQEGKGSPPWSAASCSQKQQISLRTIHPKQVKPCEQITTTNIAVIFSLAKHIVAYFNKIMEKWNHRWVFWCNFFTKHGNRFHEKNWSFLHTKRLKFYIFFRNDLKHPCIDANIYTNRSFPG